MKIVIIGNGIAGNEAASILRKLDHRNEITIISDEGLLQYNPCSLPYFAGGDVSGDMIFSKSITDYSDNNINLILNTKIVKLDSVNKMLITESGEKHSYDYLLLAYGAEPYVPLIKGLNKSGIYYCSRFSEFEKLREITSEHVVVIGSGAIGIEVAEALKKRGNKVSIVEIFSWIIPGLFDRKPAEFLKSNLKKNNIEVFCNEKAELIDGKKRPAAVVTNKRTIPCSSVVIAAGISPNIDWLKGSGIKVDRGILVNDFMQTNITDIYSCGDCSVTKDAASGESGIYALKHNAIDQARVAAKNILGGKIRYSGSSTIARVSFFNTHAASFGITSSRFSDAENMEIIEKQSEKDYLRIILKKGYIKGFQAIGEYARFSGFFQDFMKRNDNITELRNNREGKTLHGAPYQWIYHKIGFLLGINLE